MMTHTLTTMAMDFPLPIVRKGTRVFHTPGRMAVLQTKHPETEKWIDIAYGEPGAEMVDQSLLDMANEGGPLEHTKRESGWDMWEVV